MDKDVEKTIINSLDAHHRQNIDDIEIDIYSDDLIAMEKMEDYTQNLSIYMDKMKNEISNVPALTHTNCKRDVGLRWEVVSKILDKLEEQYVAFDSEYPSPTMHAMLDKIVDEITQYVREISDKFKDLYDSYDYCAECKVSKEILNWMRIAKHHKIN
jgi:hypothetical protein